MKFFRIILHIFLLLIFFYAGVIWTAADQAGKQLQGFHANVQAWHELHSSDIKFRTQKVYQMTSGNYILTKRFPNREDEVHNVELQFSKGAPLNSSKSFRGGISNTLKVEDHYIEWTGDGIMYEANAKFSGKITSSTSAHGLVFGWNPNKETVGAWELSAQ